jgi:hypothetical protein
MFSDSVFRFETDNNKLIQVTTWSGKIICYISKIYIKSNDDRILSKIRKKLTSKNINADFVAAILYKTHNQIFIKTDSMRKEIMAKFKTKYRHISYDDREYINNNLNDDREIILEYIKYDSTQLHYASERLKNDIGILKTVIKSGGIYLCFVANRFKKDFKIMRKVIKYESSSCANLCYASDEIKDNIKIAKLVIKYHGVQSLCHMSERLKNHFNYHDSFPQLDS